MNLFGKAKPKGVAPKDAMNKLRETMEVLEKREAFLQSKIDNETKIAKANASKNKRRKAFILIHSGYLGFKKAKTI